MTAPKELIAPPVLRRTTGGQLQFRVAGHPVEGVIAVNSACDRDGSYTTIVFHNSSVIFEVEKPDPSELDA